MNVPTYEEKEEEKEKEDERLSYKVVVYQVAVV